MDVKPRLAVSSCLLGQKVRNNGEAAEFTEITHKWNGHFDLIGVCPEVGIGMGVPRPKTRLLNDGDSIRLVDSINGEDFTGQILEYAQVQADALVASGICGFVFKNDSPSCGLERVNVYHDGHTRVTRDGKGMFAKIFTTLYPHIPVVDEERLKDVRQAEHFLARVHFFSLWREVGLSGWTAQTLTDFHNANKQFLLHRSPGAKRRLGRLITSGFDNSEHAETVALTYMTEAQKTLNTPTQKGSIANAMEHAPGKITHNLPSVK